MKTGTKLLLGAHVVAIFVCAAALFRGGIGWGIVTLEGAGAVLAYLAVAFPVLVGKPGKQQPCISPLVLALPIIMIGCVYGLVSGRAPGAWWAYTGLGLPFVVIGLLLVCRTAARRLPKASAVLVVMGLPFVTYGAYLQIGEYQFTRRLEVMVKEGDIIQISSIARSLPIDGSHAERGHQRVAIWLRRAVRTILANENALKERADWFTRVLTENTSPVYLLMHEQRASHYLQRYQTDLQDFVNDANEFLFFDALAVEIAALIGDTTSITAPDISWFRSDLWPRLEQQLADRASGERRGNANSSNDIDPIWPEYPYRPRGPVLKVYPLRYALRKHLRRQDYDLRRNASRNNRVDEPQKLLLMANRRMSDDSLFDGCVLPLVRERFTAVTGLEFKYSYFERAGSVRWEWSNTQKKREGTAIAMRR